MSSRHIWSYTRHQAPFAPQNFYTRQLLHNTTLTSHSLYAATHVWHQTSSHHATFTSNTFYPTQLESSKSWIQQNQCAKIMCNAAQWSWENDGCHERQSSKTVPCFHAMLKWWLSRKTAPWTAEVMAVIAMTPGKSWVQQKLNPANVESNKIKDPIASRGFPSQILVRGHGHC